MAYKILGVSGSLRNARFGHGSKALIEEIQNLDSKEDLIAFLKEQTRIRVEEFIAAGRADDLPFDKTYKNLQKAKGDKGLSNSEAALAAGMWGAHQEGAGLAHVGLASHFPMSGKPRRLDALKKTVLSCDAILISGPVYFGDRGSLVNEFIEFLHNDDELRAFCKGRVYAGIAVGAKRNGGQETTLIYQIIDMTNLDMLAVGNSAQTTSQYGGTVLAGDVGTAWQDEYGLNTSIGTGQRIAKITKSLMEAEKYRIKDKVKIGIWIVQDSDDKRGKDYVRKLVNANASDDVDYQVIDLTDEDIARCIACDLCPTHHASKEEYSCIIGTKSDFFVKEHADLVEADAILLMAYSPVNRSKVRTVYQKFFERTRYIRRGHYMLSDRLVGPFVISEMNANQNLHIRMLTSLIRHHTILHHPIIGIEHRGQLINEDYFGERFKDFTKSAIRTTAARLKQDASDAAVSYNPVGYVISNERNRVDDSSGKTDQFLKENQDRHLAEKQSRLEKIS